MGRVNVISPRPIFAHSDVQPFINTSSTMSPQDSPSTWQCSRTVSSQGGASTWQCLRTASPQDGPSTAAKFKDGDITGKDQSGTRKDESVMDSSFLVPLMSFFVPHVYRRRRDRHWERPERRCQKTVWHKKRRRGTRKDEQFKRHRERHEAQRKT